MNLLRILFILLIVPFNMCISEKDDLKHQIGVIVPLTGDFAKYGNKIAKGLNASKSKNLEYIFEDEACKPKAAITAYLKLSSLNSIKYFLGPWCGSPQTAVAPMLKTKKQIAILVSSAPRAVFKLSGGRMFSTQHSIEEESIFNAKKAYEMGARKTVIIFFENDFSRAHEKAFRKEFKGSVLKTLTYQSFDGVALRSLALQVKRLAPDTIYVPDAFPLMHGLLRILHEINFRDVKIFSVYSAESSDVLEVSKGYNRNLYYSYPLIEGKNALEHFPPMAAKIMNKVIDKCGSTNTDCGIKYLKENFPFDSSGVLSGKIGLKKIVNNKFAFVDY